MEVDALIVSMENIDSKLLNKLGNLKLISKFGVGLDNIDLSSCENLGVKVNFTPGVNKVSVAEMTIAFMISLSRNMYQSSIWGPRNRSWRWFLRDLDPRCVHQQWR